MRAEVIFIMGQKNNGKDEAFAEDVQVCGKYQAHWEECPPEDPSGANGCALRWYGSPWFVRCIFFWVDALVGDTELEKIEPYPRHHARKTCDAWIRCCEERKYGLQSKQDDW